MSDIRYLDELQAELDRAARSSLAPRRRTWAGWAAAAAAFALVLVLGAVLWLVGSPEEVAAPTTTTEAPFAPTSLPTEWARVPHQDVFAPDTSLTLIRVVHGPLGFVAIGHEGNGSDMIDGAVLSSGDGVDWIRLDNGSDLQGISLQTIAHGSDSIVVAGLDTVTASSSFYSSTNGTEWSLESVDASGQISGTVVQGIAPHGKGFVAVGSGWIGEDADAVETGVAWIQDSEGFWREITAAEFAASSLNDVVVVDDEILVVGLSEIAEGQSEPTAWRSADGGATWSSTLLPRIESTGFAGASSVSEHDGAWMIVGFEAESGAVWMSDEGIDWRRHEPAGDMFAREKIPTFMYDVLLTDSGAIAVGAEFLGPDVERVTWISADGSQWDRLSFAESTHIEGASLVATSLASDGATVVAVGREMLMDGVGAGAVWISPPGPTMATLEAAPAPEVTESDETGSDPVLTANAGWLRLGIDSLVAEGFENADGTLVGPSLNPFLMSDAADIARLVVAGAYRIDATTGELTPWLVERIPRLGDGLEAAGDGTVAVTYTVREDAVWEDGQPVTGGDLAFTHNLIMLHADQFNVDTSVHELIDTESMVVDGKSLSFRLLQPDTAYERLFEWVLPSHIINPETFLEDWNEELWPSAGPFRFVSFERPAAHLTEPSIVTVERNPLYWETDPATSDALPHLEGIELHVFPGGSDPRDSAKLIKDRELDAVMGGLTAPWALPSYGDLDEQGLGIRTEWDTLYEAMAFNLDDKRLDVNPSSHNDQLAYRQAVLSAIDRQELGAATGGGTVDSIVGMAVDRYNNDAWHAFDDQDQVEELLAGLDEPLEALYTSSSADSTIAIGEAVAGQLTSAGIPTNTQFDGDFFGTQLPDRQLDLYAWRAFAGGVGLSSVVDALGLYLPEQTILDWSGLEAEATRFADLLDEARSEFDQDRQAELLGEAESVLADNALTYPLVKRQATSVIYWPDTVEGIIPNRLHGWDTWNAAQWRSPSR